MAGEPKRKRGGGVATALTAIAYSAIAAFAGPEAAMWAAAGFIAASLIAFWEAGRARKIDRSTT